MRLHAPPTSPPHLPASPHRSFEKYLALLTQFLAKSKEEKWRTTLDNGTSKSPGFLWSSPLSALPPSSYFSLPSLQIDHAMALTFYAAALQKKAGELCQAILDAETSQEGGEPQVELDKAHAAAVGFFTRAVGIYSHMRDALLPHLTYLPADAPSELRPSGTDALEALALARAQAVAAHKAEVKGASFPALAAVHRGAVDLFEAAAAKTRMAVGERGVAERLRRFLALSSELHAAKALRAMAGICKEEGDMGKAAACLRVSERGWGWEMKRSIGFCSCPPVGIPSVSIA